MRKLLHIGFVLGGLASLALGFVAYFGYHSISAALWAMAVSNLCSAGLWGSMARQSTANVRVIGALKAEYETLLANYMSLIRREANAMLRAGDPGDREVDR